MRDNWLSNRVFKSYEDIVAHCCEAWRKLESQPWAHHVHRAQRMGKWVLINERPYYALSSAYRSKVSASIRRDVLI